jgi:hypothetical protein
MRRQGSRLGIVALTCLLAMSGIGEAQSSSAPAFGSAQTIQTIQAFGFIPAISTDAYVAANGAISCVGAPCTFLAPVSLPSGALVSAIQAEVCDFDASSEVAAVLYRVVTPGGAVQPLGTSQTAGNPGCVLASGAFPTPETIDNVTYTYALQVDLGASATTRLHAVRIYYSLQVSQPPPVASFSDVPSNHPFYRFVEALARSGITAGCGGGLFCVNAPITRGEMAVFLAAALGLHFAP